MSTRERLENSGKLWLNSKGYEVVRAMQEDQGEEGQENLGVDEIMELIERAVGMTCPRHLRHLKDDIVQDARLRLARVADLDDPRFQVRSYLWRAAHSAILDAMRAARRRALESSEEGAELDRRTLSERPGPERAAASREIAAAIRDCLETLVESRRRVVTLNLLGFGMSEIATMLHEQRKRIDNLLYRGLVNLRECLLGKGVRP